MQKVTFLNPYKIRLKQEPFMQISSKPVHINGDFRIYKYYKDWYVHTFKNIVIAERTKPNKELITNILGKTQPSQKDLYLYLVRPKEAIQYD